ncbi:MAG TPA: TadE family protein, partial [Terriglobales bacterium]
MRRMFVLSRRQRGQSMTELALALGLLVLMIFGTVDFARIWNIQQVLDNAARTGARYSALPAAGSETLPTTAAVTTVVNNLLTTAGLSSGVTLALNQAAV